MPNRGSEEERKCRRAVEMHRRGVSLREIARSMKVSLAKVQRWKARVKRNGRYVRSCKESLKQRRAAAAKIYTIPILNGQNNRRNYKVRRGNIVYSSPMQSHQGWCEFRGATDVKAGLRLNRSAHCAVAKRSGRAPSARTLRRHRAATHGYALDPGPKSRKNWAAPVHLSQS